ncbi:MAG: hypothetical protein J6U75_00570 [Clostridia bacterium]|nr:hypothetical protein [Clostridia bacterium]
MNGARNSYSVRSKGAIYTLLFFAILCAVAMFVCSCLFSGYGDIVFQLSAYALATAILVVLAAVFFIISLNGRKSSAVLATISFILTALSFLPNFIAYIVNGMDLSVTFYLVMFISLIFLAILFGVAVISSLSGFRIKTFAILAGAFGLVFAIGMPVYEIFAAHLFELGWDFFKFYIFPLAADLTFFLMYLFISCAVLTHAIKNRVPPANGGARYYAPVQAADYVPSNDPDSPEAKLAALSAKLEFGIITKEEYDARRAEIINNI